MTGGEVVPTLMVVLVGSAVVSVLVDIPFVTAMTQTPSWWGPAPTW